MPTYRNEADVSGNAQRPAKRRKVLRAVIMVLIAVVLIAVVVVGDGLARSAAEATVEQEITTRLPSGAGEVTAEIGGFAFIPQLFTGHLEQLDIAFALNADALPAPDGESGVALQIADSTITHDGEVGLLGFSIGYTVTLAAGVENGVLVLTPTGVEASTGAASLDVGKLIDLDTLTVRVCTAKYLPESLKLTSVKVVGSEVHFAVSGLHVPIDLAKLKARGACE